MHVQVRVGWGEDEHGLLVYNPLACPHIISKLVDDESASAASTSIELVSTTRPLAEAFAVAPPVERLALFKAGALDGELGITAAREATREILGKGVNPNDGWDNAEDMPEGVVDEAGGRARRNKNEKGSIMASASFRDGRVAEGKSAADKKEAERVKMFKERRTDVKVLELNSSAEAKLSADADAKLSNDEMISFIRARSNKAVPQAEKKSELLISKVVALKAKPVVDKLSMEPDGYAAWLEQLEMAAATAKAAKAPAKAANAASATVHPQPAAGTLPTEDHDSSDEESLEETPSEMDADEVVSAAAVVTCKVGLEMEIHGCDADECDYVCSICDWELCIVEADHGRTCDVRIKSDDTVCEGVLAHRFLRMPIAVGSHKRKAA